MTSGDNDLNLETLEELREMLEEGLDEVLEEYMGDAERQLKLLNNAVESGDLQAIGSISHSLKGSSGNLGIAGVYRQCAALEQEVKAGNVHDAAASLAAIERELKQAHHAINHFLNA